MKTPAILITALTIAAIGLAPAAASAGTYINHNEVLATSIGA